MRKKPMGVLPAVEEAVRLIGSVPKSSAPADEKSVMYEGFVPESSDPDSSRMGRSPRAVQAAIDKSVDELGMHSQSAPGLGGDSPAPAPSAPLFAGARGVQVTHV